MPKTNRYSFQDSGYGWVLTAIGFCISLIELGTFKSFGVFLLPIRESLDCSITALGSVMAASHTTCYLLVPMVNILVEKLGPRWLVIAGGITVSACTLGACFTRDITQFSAFIILLGIGFSLAYVPPLVVILQYFPTNPALPVAIAATGCAVGMTIYPPLTDFLIGIYGWRGTMMILAAVSANICVLGALIKPLSPEYAVLVTDQRARDETRTLWNCCTKIAKGFCKVLPLDVIWNNPKFTIHVFAFAMVGIMYSAWMIYLVPHAMARGIESQLATFLSTAGGVGTLVGRILYGPILHRGYIKAIQLYILLAFANSVAFILDPIASDNYSGLVCLAFVNGLSIGTMSALPILVAQQVLDDEWTARGWGAQAFMFAVGELAGGALAGFVYDTTGSYEASFLLLGGLSAVITLVLANERLLTFCSGS